ncbi:GGDEF domain-containing protein [Roseixanthobacter pseudopolyaromaticivorans]|uniref:GGDEF domain-containing protein n=1 Tax=Xanthobacteraceae TaxID=335928 RepID=UPI003728A44D
MDPWGALGIATLMMLTNGCVLGLMYRDLPAALRPAAISWEIGTLLIALGCATFASEDLIPRGFMIMFANGVVMLGLTAYVHALRQFYGRRPRPLLLLPLAVGVFGLTWFAFVQPDTSARIQIVSIVWLTLMGASWYTLRAQSARDTAMSRRVLMGIFAGVMTFVLFRAVYFGLVGLPPNFSVGNGSTWVNLATTMVAALLPVIGTTAFVLMCSERIRRQWERAASTDYLTGLANRRTLIDIGALRFEANRVQSGGLALAVIDVDNFKDINDRHGHEIGDVALKHVAMRLQASTRGSEMLARLGGEEFVVLMSDVDEPQALACGERLRRAVHDAPFMAGNVMIPITVSVGVAGFRPTDPDFDALLRRADRALYVAKTRGRNRVDVDF